MNSIAAAQPLVSVASSSAAARKRKMSCGLERDHEAHMDRISELSNEILVSILCMLPLKEAARTSVLSRRWQKTWEMIPSFNFYCAEKMKMALRIPDLTTETEKLAYVDWVNLVLEKFRDKPTAATEELTIGYPLDSKYSDRINQWVEFAAGKQVKKLKLDLGINKAGAGQSYDLGLLASSSISCRRFSRLRDLYLRGVDVAGNVVERLLSDSPFVERLCVIDSQQLHELDLAAAAAAHLNYLEIYHCLGLQHLKLSAPNLKRVKLFISKSLIRLNMDAPALSRVTFGLFQLPAHSDRDILDCFQQLLHQFSHVKRKLSIKLSCEAFCSIATTIDSRHRFPQLRNVELLKIQIRSQWPMWYHSRQHPRSQSLLWPCGLVKAAPFLHKLSIKLFHMKHAVFKSCVDFTWMDEDIPKKVKANVGHYSHRCLKVVELVGFTGSRLEVELVLHLLQIAVSLQTLIIRVCAPTPLWSESDILIYERNQIVEICRECAQLLKTQACPDVDVVVI